ncbi:MAG TPA: sigma 54-interacting transcriptional regulator, partial [Terriglobales bacterium]|nr:sigma 54-interacting transcriptional regulator [Terriglobales bacterium]
MADLVVCDSGLQQLFSNISGRLHQVVDFDMIVFSLHNPANNKMQLLYSESSTGDLEQLGELSVEDTATGWAWQNQCAVIIQDIDKEPRFERGLKVLRETGIKSYFCFPLTIGQKRLGGLGLGSPKSRTCEEKDMRFLQRVAELISLAIENVQASTALHQEKERIQMLLEVNAALVSNLDLQELFPAISGFIRKVVPQDYASLLVYQERSQTLQRYATDWPGKNGSSEPESELPLKGSAAGTAFLAQEIKVYDRAEFIRLKSNLIDKIKSLQWFCSVPLLNRKGPIGTINFVRTQAECFNSRDMGLLNQIARQIAVAMDNSRAYEEIAALTMKLSVEKLYLQSEIRSQLNFEEIIGESHILKHVLDQAKTVATSDATVLILGETGTGKELIARAIHRMSRRSEASFIKMNCAAIPTGLLESELFGHEKGAFTGAVSQKTGRLELADKGTLFLDEIGDIALELQPKLLRVLQDKEFERLGGTRTIGVNVRLIAATNQDLAKEVSEKHFRSDLFYRLNVFPIRIPPLRERADDIPLLVRYFVHKFAARMGKTIDSIPSEAMRALCTWHWPGNVRELENFMERSVILTEGSVLRAPLAELNTLIQEDDNGGTLEHLEREFIVRALRET